jgi:hypothetical protein
LPISKLCFDSPPSLPRSKLSLTLCPDRRKIRPAACHWDWEAALAGEKLGIRFATRTVRPPIFSVSLATVINKGLPRLAPPQERQVDTHKPVLCFDLWSATIVYSYKVWQRHLYLYSEGEVFKIASFKGAIGKLLNIVATHIEGLRYPPIGLFDTKKVCQISVSHKHVVVGCLMPSI